MTSVAAESPVSWLSTETFTDACSALPLVSIDLMITRPGKDGEELLLGLRTNRPAKGWWFSPGGRIRKNEPLHQAMQRIAVSELNLAKALYLRATLLGAWDHFYPDSAFSSAVSTHYVNLAHWIRLDGVEARTIEPPMGAEHQHAAWQWMPLEEVARSELVHEYVQRCSSVVASILIGSALKPT